MLLKWYGYHTSYDSNHIEKVKDLSNDDPVVCLNMCHRIMTYYSMCIRSKISPLILICIGGAGFRDQCLFNVDNVETIDDENPSLIVQ